jgi:hypothetical protein
MDWFTADKAGLANFVKRRGVAWVLYEIIQNGLDQDVTSVNVALKPIGGAAQVLLTCEDDDPKGFEKLSLAWTLFADSTKRSDPTKAGRFTMGEKLVLSLAHEAKIVTTTGTVLFDSDGRHTSKVKRSQGSLFQARLPMTRAEYEEVCKAATCLLPREGVTLTFNGEVIPHRKSLKSFQANLTTEYADKERFLRRTVRKTTVSVHEVLEGEVPTLFELGIPIVGLSGGERWHINIHQRVPLNVDRDNVTPAYLQTIRVLLANEMKDFFTKEDAKQVWVDAATEDERIDSLAVEKVLDERFGKKRAVFDASDPEANKQLMNEGFAIIHGGSLSKGQWNNVRDAGLAIPSGQLRPSGVQYDPDGDPETIIPESDYTSGMREIVDFSKAVAKMLIRKEIRVKLVNEPIALPHAAWYGKGVLAFNVGRLGKDWFHDGIHPKHVELILHELAHDAVKDHLTREFADEVGRLGVRLVRVALSDPGFFKTRNVFILSPHT